MAWTLVGDVADVIRVEVLRPSPLIVDRAWQTKPSLDRALGLRARFLDLSPTKLLPGIAHRSCSSVTFYRPGRALSCDTPRSLQNARLAPAAAVTSDPHVRS